MSHAQVSKRADSRRERKKTRTRQRLLQSAWELFQERGYDHTTVEDITEAADVAKGTFFNYFETKQALLDDIALWRIELLGKHALAGDDVPDSAIARIKLVMKAMSEELSPERELVHQLFVARISAPIRRESAHRLGSLMHELATQAQARNEIRDDIDPGLVARLLMTCFFHGFVRHHHRSSSDQRGSHPEGHRKPESLSDEVAAEMCLRPVELVDVLMNGLGGPEWRVE